MIPLSLTHSHQNELLYSFPALFVEKSDIKIVVNKWRRPSRIYVKFVYFHRLDFGGFLIYVFFS